jgi:error-prone DNA polymerase
MSVLQESIALVREGGGDVDLAHLPPDDHDVYQMLQQADTVGVFQVESRAQMATLPRIYPERFYDLVVQVAIIRPGPIVGDMVHPYIRRRRGREPVTYAHPSLEPILARTLGVPLFQEQLLRMAMVTAGFTGSEAEELRRAFGFRRSEQRMADVEAKLRAGLSRQGITGETAQAIVHAITAFALYGFPESHASSFALLAYASAYLKVHHPAAFFAALLNNQPMGFYHASTVVKDAQRRGQRVLPIDVTRSDWLCTVESESGVRPAVRLGLRYVKGLRETVGHAIVAAREAGMFTSVADLTHRAGVDRGELETLASIGALAAFGGTRRASLWMAARASAGPLFNMVERGLAPENPLHEMNEGEQLVADYAGTGVTLGRHPMAMRREALARVGVTRARDLTEQADGARVRVAGSVIVRQRPGTAKGFVFLSLEDETGITNVIVTPGLFARFRRVLVTEPFLLVDGILQFQDGVVSVRAGRVEALPANAANVPSHDFG